MLSKTISIRNPLKISAEELLNLLKTAAEFKLKEIDKKLVASPTIQAISAQNKLSIIIPPNFWVLESVLNTVMHIVQPWFVEVQAINDPDLKPPFSFEHNLSKQTSLLINMIQKKTEDISVQNLIKEFRPQLSLENYFTHDFLPQEVQTSEQFENLLYATPDFENEMPEWPDPADPQ